MRWTGTIRVVIATLTGATLVAAGLLVGHVSIDRTRATAPQPEWTEVEWPFPMDAWDKGKAFQCKAKHCGTEVNLYLRSKVGFCNCVISVDDDDVDRTGDLDLLGADRAALGSGRPINVRWMEGRSRAYAIRGGGPTAKSALSVAFHERCDMIVATAAIGQEDPTGQESAVVGFLNGEVALRWYEVTLGL